MGVAGVRRALPLNGGRIVMATGCGPTAAGTGQVTSRGDGLVTIMAPGSTTLCKPGSGFPVWNGDQHGLPGEVAEVITDGLL